MAFTAEQLVMNNFRDIKKDFRQYKTLQTSVQDPNETNKHSFNFFLNGEIHVIPDH